MAAKRKVTSREKAGDLSDLALPELKKRAAKEPYAVFIECERRRGSKSKDLAKVAKAAAAKIEGLLVDADDPTRAFMEFGSELEVEIYIDDEPEEGVYKAIEILEKRL